jgi:hypothetical protein
VPVAQDLARTGHNHRIGKSGSRQTRIAQGHDLVFVSRQLGRASPTIAITTYVHLFDNARHPRVARDQLDAEYRDVLTTPRRAPGAAIFIPTPPGRRAGRRSNVAASDLMPAKPATKGQPGTSREQATTAFGGTRRPPIVLPRQSLPCDGPQSPSATCSGLVRMDAEAGWPSAFASVAG